MTTSISIFGSTGVIGVHTLEVVAALGPEYEIVSLSAGRNMSVLAEQIRKYRPRYVSVQDAEARIRLVNLLDGFSEIPDIGIGDDGLETAASIPSDIVISAIVGAQGLIPTRIAVERGATIGLANKETLVAAGDIIMPLAHQKGAIIIPVDSEHSALFQCLKSGQSKEVHSYILTASGGPFRTWTKEQMQQVTVEQALCHPNWSMGKKITIDSASMMNKGLEVIEAHHLFNAPYDKIKVLVHPQSVIHSMVEFNDGSTLAQMATPDMRLPIQYALTYPNRVQSNWPRLNLLERGPLTFESPDLERFPALRLAYQAGAIGGFAPCVLNAANEVAVAAFLAGRVSFMGMARVVEHALNQHLAGTPKDVSEILAMDEETRIRAEAMVQKGGWNG